ncbi:YqgE/AlgH family protein [Celeribacter arenosi]|uniref:UPF0301 protein GCM10022404_10280 n=1 Tax=Celeribacter arenosi TaxID=792649 RepID=A0ABP7K0R4_9RHOB
MDTDLTGKLLVAMPGIGDPRFENAVVFVCAHSSDGSMGLMINKISEEIEPGDIFDQLDIAVSATMRPLPVHFGGPVEIGRGFVLHSSDYTSENGSMDVCEGYSMTASREILRDLAMGEGPAARLLCLGYAGWGPGQLEDEISANGWLTCEADAQIVFDLSADKKWEAALRSIGVTPALLSSEAGRA